MVWKTSFLDKGILKSFQISPSSSLNFPPQIVSREYKSVRDFWDGVAQVATKKEDHFWSHVPPFQKLEPQKSLLCFLGMSPYHEALWATP